MQEKLKQFLMDPAAPLIPSTAKEWAVAIALYGMLIALIAIAGYVSELYDAVMLLTEKITEIR